MQFIRINLVFFLFTFCMPAFSLAAEKTNLSNELESLSLPENQVPAMITEEKIYSVQSRHNNLRLQPELSFNYAQKVSDTGFISSREVGAGLRLYINSRWSVGANFSYAFNELSATSQDLYEKQGILATVPYVKYRADLTARFHTMYGKFRLSMDKVMYFDQFLSLGPGIVVLDTGNATAGVGEVGFAFWFNKNWSTRIGLKDYIYNEKSANKSGLVNQLLVYIDAGFILGGA